MAILQKISDEGSSSPFTARLFSGILELRDSVLNRQVGDKSLYVARSQFDALYDPVLNAMQASRTATSGIERILQDHQRKLSSGEIVRFQGDTLDLAESVDQSLREEFNKLLVNGVIAIKASQKVTNYFGISIGCTFSEDPKFAKGRDELINLGHDSLAKYLADVRQTWSADFIDRRNGIEHDGWSLPLVGYEVHQPNRTIRIVEPEIDGTPVSKYSTLMLGRILNFVEDVIVYSFKTRVRPPLVVVEIPNSNRDPSSPKRFRLGILGQETEWQPVFQDLGFP